MSCNTELQGFFKLSKCITCDAIARGWNDGYGSAVMDAGYRLLHWWQCRWGCGNKSDVVMLVVVVVAMSIPDIIGEEFRIDDRDDDGQLAAFEASSGKSYEVVSSTAHEPKSRLALKSAGGANIRHKIKRRVSFVHYMEPSEVPKDDVKKLKQLYERSSGTSLTNSSFATPSKSIRPGQSSGRASTHSSGRKSSLSEEKVRPKPSRSSQNSGQSSGHSEEKKAKKKHMA
ncbi:uncharacterized protein LOC143588808 [Bidens hawaiensis]|uniref:uncharacterized protein LOC143588808 n=1 Tax=Bidens hawaiensis TaxID=980011 RepID=UPI00404A22F8